MERAFKYEEIPDGVIEDSPGQLNELHDMAVEEIEEPEDLLSPEELDREGEQEAEIELVLDMGRTHAFDKATEQAIY